MPGAVSWTGTERHLVQRPRRRDPRHHRPRHGRPAPLTCTGPARTTHCTYLHYSTADECPPAIPVSTWPPYKPYGARDPAPSN